jgi:outer membrane protein OmpA-like peptidoglycan-associated protein
MQQPDAVAIATPKNAPILQTAGKSDEVVIVKPNAENTGYIVAAEDWSLAISSTTKLVQGNTADSSARVVIEKGNTVTTSGTGFKPLSQVDVYVYSTPIWLGAVITDEFGNFTTTLPMPAALAEGDHTFQAQGLTPDDRQRTAAVPITLVPATVVAKPGQLRFDVYFAMNSTVITIAERAKIARQVKSALAKSAKNAKLTVTVVGWVQPNPNPGNITFLSTNRAKNVADLMKKLGLKGSYTLSYPGLDKNDIPTARRSSVVIKWNLSK